MSLFDFFKKKGQQEEPKSENKQETSVVKKLRTYPFSVGTANLRYSYDLPITEATPGSINAVLGDCEKVVEVSVSNNKISLLYGGTPFAYIQDDTKLKMVEDYMRRGDPINAVLKADGSHTNLRFYKDLKKYAGNREQEVLRLTAYKKRDYQDAIISLNEQEELSCFEDSGTVTVSSPRSGDIGRLPQKAANRAMEENIYAIYFEKCEIEENENGEETYIPYVRIYW